MRYLRFLQIPEPERNFGLSLLLWRACRTLSSSVIFCRNPIPLAILLMLIMTTFSPVLVSGMSFQLEHDRFVAQMREYDGKILLFYFVLQVILAFAEHFLLPQDFDLAEKTPGLHCFINYFVIFHTVFSCLYDFFLFYATF